MSKETQVTPSNYDLHDDRSIPFISEELHNETISVFFKKINEYNKINDFRSKIIIVEYLLDKVAMKIFWNGKRWMSELYTIDSI